MATFGWTKTTRLAAGALFALVAFCVFAPSKAEAGCSSYVSHAAGQHDFARSIDPLILGSPDVAVTDLFPSTPANRPKPCSGPSCSSKQFPPVTPTVLTEVRYVEPGALLRSCHALDQNATSFQSAPPSSPRAIKGVSAIFHPPRPSERRPIV
jgi:hypothetical protein